MAASADVTTRGLAVVATMPAPRPSLRRIEAALNVARHELYHRGQGGWVVFDQMLDLIEAEGWAVLEQVAMSPDDVATLARHVHDWAQLSRVRRCR